MKTKSFITFSFILLGLIFSQHRWLNSETDRSPSSLEGKDIRVLPGSNGPWENPGFNYAKCTNDTFNHSTTPFNKKGVFRKECAPEVLYSWQTLEMLKMYTSDSKPKKILPIERLFAWRTPIGTFGYGIAPLRMKLRPTVTFIDIPVTDRLYTYTYIGWYGKQKREETCAYWKNKYKAPPQTIFIMLDADRKSAQPEGVQEYVLCDAEAIESVSVVSPEILQEMQWELDQIFGRETLSENSIRHDAMAINIKLPWQYGFDRMPWAETDLVKSLNWIRDAIVTKDLTKVYYAEDVTPNREAHFSVSRPNYYLRRPDLKGDEHKISQVQIIGLDDNQQQIDSEISKDLQAECIGKSYCYWNAGLDPAKWKFATKVNSIGVQWNCESSNEVYKILIPIENLKAVSRKEDDVLTSQFQIQCETKAEVVEITPPVKPVVLKIKVVSASYGSKTDLRDVTKFVSDFCDGKESCQYKISSKYLGIAKRTFKSPSFEVKFTCDPKKDPETVSIPKDAEDEIWNLSCKEPSKRISP